MKTAAKVFIIIGMVSGAFAIYPIVLGIFAIKKLDEAKTSDEIKTWGWITLFFVNLLAGILMLCLKDDALGEASEPRYNSEGNIIEKYDTPSEQKYNLQEINPKTTVESHNCVIRNKFDFVTAELYDEL